MYFCEHSTLSLFSIPVLLLKFLGHWTLNKYYYNNNNNNNIYLKSNIHKMFSRLLYKMQHIINNIAHSNYKQ